MYAVYYFLRTSKRDLRGKTRKNCCILQVVLCQINIFHHELTQNTTTDFLTFFRFTQIVLKLKPLVFKFWISEQFCESLRVSKSHKQFLVSIISKDERCHNVHYIKLSQHSFFGRSEDTIICFRDSLTFSTSEKIRCHKWVKWWQNMLIWKGITCISSDKKQENLDSIKLLRKLGFFFRPQFFCSSFRKDAWFYH